MALSKQYTKEQLNYFRICYVTTDILTEGLREIFKQEWDKQYKLTKGEWKDEPRNGTDFYNLESPSKQRRNAHLLATMQNGNREEWDCTMLFYAILFSDCVGGSVNGTVKKNVDDLRNFRNQEFAHIAQGNLSQTDFQSAICKVDVAFQGLGLPTGKIQDIKNQTTFATEELQKVLKMVDDLKEEVRVLEDQLQKETPSFCILPPKPLHDIDGREREVSKIAQQLRELKKSNDNRLSYLYISGNPGSGKSQLAGLVAKRFFDEVKEKPDNSSFVMTVNAASQDSLLESYASFARHLKCPDHSVMETLNSKDLNVEEKITNLKMLVAVKVSCYTSWLMVVDNVTTMSSVFVHLPQSGNEAWARGQLLITTQETKSVPLKSSFVYHISVSKGMESDDACSLLAMLSGIQDSDFVREVAEKLDYQPLALAGAATFVKEIRQDKASRHFGWSEYLKMLEKGKRETTENTLEYTNPVYPISMTKAINLAVETLMRSDKLVKHLFTLLSLCAPEQLKVDVAISYITNVHNDFDEADKELIRMSLRRCSLLLFHDDQGGDFIRVHQVVHDAIKIMISTCPESQTPQVVNDVITAFSNFIDSVPPMKRRLETRHVVPHLKAITMVTNNKQKKVSEKKENMFQINDRGIAEKCKKLANICFVHCEFNVAKTYLEYSLTINLEKLGPEHVDVATSYQNLAAIHQALGDFEQAKEYQQCALAIQMDKLGPEHVNVATSYYSLAILYLALGDFEQSRKYQQRALAIQLDKLGPEHVNVATSYQNLASIYRALGDFQQAKEYQQRALAITLDRLGPQHVDAAIIYDNVASFSMDLGDSKQAKEYQQRALAIQLEKLGPEHVDVAASYQSLASIYRDLGDFKQAKEYQQHALAIRLDKLGPEHVDVASSYDNLASFYMDLGDFKQAKEYQQRALAIQLDKLGPEHVIVASSYHNLASIYRALGYFEQAKEYQQRALAIQLDKLGPEHVNVGASYHNLAFIYQTLEDFEQAEEYQQRSLAIQLDKLDPEHVTVASSYNNLALIYQHLGDFKQAKEYQRRALAIQLDKLGPEHVYVARSYHNLASIYNALGDFKQAKQYQQRSLEIQLNKFGPEHVNVATSYSNFAAIYVALGNFDQAKEYQQRALTIQLDKLGPEHVDVATCYDNLACIHLALNDFEQAKEYQQRALAIRLERFGPEHVNVATCYHNLASIHLALNDLEQAKEYQQRALAIRLERFGPEHVNVATCYHNLASIHLALNDFEQAKDYQQRALAIRLDNLGPEHAHVATSYGNLASIYEALGDFEQAKEHQQHALAIQLQKLGLEQQQKQ